MYRQCGQVAALWSLFWFPGLALGQTVPPIVQAAVEAAIPTTVTQPFIKSIGAAYEHRPYEPATLLGTIGMDISVESTLVKIPDDFITAIESLGGGGSLSALTAIGVFPGLKLHFHKGLGPFDLGASGLIYPSYFFLGGDLKISLYQPEEGISAALRLKFSYTSIALGTTLTSNSYTATPELLISRKISWADPYLGVGYQYIWGSLTIPFDFMGTTYNVTLPTVTAGNFYAFGGVGMTLGSNGTGLRLCIEGAYSLEGLPYLGTKIGLKI